MPEAPQVSICIPVRNGMPFLPQTVTAALAQEGVDHEVVVRNNASTDGTREYLESLHHPRLRVLHAEQGGSIGDSFRAVTQAARGDLVKLLCADDLITPDACAKQAAVLSDPEVAVVASLRDMIDSENRVLFREQGLRWLRGRRTGPEVVRAIMTLGFNPIGEPSGVMFRRRDYDRVDGWDDRWVYPLDLDLWLRLLQHGDFVGQPESLASFRLSTSSISGTWQLSQLQEYDRFVAELSNDPHWRIPAWQRAASALTRKIQSVTWALRQRLRAQASPSRG